MSKLNNMRYMTNFNWSIDGFWQLHAHHTRWPGTWSMTINLHALDPTTEMWAGHNPNWMLLGLWEPPLWHNILHPLHHPVHGLDCLVLTYLMPIPVESIPNIYNHTCYIYTIHCYNCSDALQMLFSGLKYFHFWPKNLVISQKSSNKVENGTNWLLLMSRCPSSVICSANCTWTWVVDFGCPQLYQKPKTVQPGNALHQCHQWWCLDIITQRSVFPYNKVTNCMHHQPYGNQGFHDPKESPPILNLWSL